MCEPNYYSNGVYVDWPYTEIIDYICKSILSWDIFGILHIS